LKCQGERGNKQMTDEKATASYSFWSRATIQSAGGEMGDRQKGTEWQNLACGGKKEKKDIVSERRGQMNKEPRIINRGGGLLTSKKIEKKLPKPEKVARVDWSELVLTKRVHR